MLDVGEELRGLRKDFARLAALLMKSAAKAIPRLVSLGDSARTLGGISVRTLRRRIKDGHILSVEWAGEHYIPASEIARVSSAKERPDDARRHAPRNPARRNPRGRS